MQSFPCLKQDLFFAMTGRYRDIGLAWSSVGWLVRGRCLPRLRLLCALWLASGTPTTRGAQDAINRPLEAVEARQRTLRAQGRSESLPLSSRPFRTGSGASTACATPVRGGRPISFSARATESLASEVGVAGCHGYALRMSRSQTTCSPALQPFRRKLVWFRARATRFRSARVSRRCASMGGADMIDARDGYMKVGAVWCGVRICAAHHLYQMSGSRSVGFRPCRSRDGDLRGLSLVAGWRMGVRPLDSPDRLGISLEVAGGLPERPRSNRRRSPRGT